MQMHSPVNVLDQGVCKAAGYEGFDLRYRNIQREAERQEKTALEGKNKAKAMAVALQTIGKFVIKKKVGENDKIFGR